jgi:hypothetical protein
MHRQNSAASSSSDGNFAGAVTFTVADMESYIASDSNQSWGVSLVNSVDRSILDVSQLPSPHASLGEISSAAQLPQLDISGRKNLQ